MNHATLMQPEFEHSRLAVTFVVVMTALWLLVQLSPVPVWQWPMERELTDSSDVAVELVRPEISMPHEIIPIVESEPFVEPQLQPVDKIEALLPIENVELIEPQSPVAPLPVEVDDISEIPEKMESTIPEVSASQLLSTLDIYRMPDADQDLEFLRQEEVIETTVPISRFIETSAEELLASNIPRLPLADGELDIRFYPFGFKGEVARAWDKITPEFGFTTRFGMKVKCKWILAIVACAWD